MNHPLLFRAAAAIIFCQILAAACFPAGNLSKSAASDWEQPSYPIVLPGFGQPLDKIAQLSAENWLSHYQSPSAPAEVRLVDFRISGLDPADMTCPRTEEYDQVYSFDYDVLPFSDVNHWIAGDGHYGQEEDWIIDKTQHLGLKRQFWRVQVELLGPCPCC